jgi:hypothetical protein
MDTLKPPVSHGPFVELDRRLVHLTSNIRTLYSRDIVVYAFYLAAVLRQ